MTKEQFDRAKEIQEQLSKIKYIEEECPYIRGIAFGSASHRGCEFVNLDDESIDKIKVIYEEYKNRLIAEFEKL